MCGIVSLFSQRIGILILVKRVFMDTSVLLRCYYAFLLRGLEYCSPVWESAAECPCQLLKSQVYSVARLCSDQRFLSLCHRRNVCWTDCVSCKMFIRTRITVCSVRVRIIFYSSTYPSCSSMSLNYQGVESPNLQGVSCRPRFVCGMTFPTLCLTPEPWIGLRVHSQLFAYLSCAFFSFPWRRWLCGCEINL